MSRLITCIVTRKTDESLCPMHWNYIFLTQTTDMPLCSLYVYRQCQPIPQRTKFYANWHWQSSLLLIVIETHLLIAIPREADVLYIPIQLIWMDSCLREQIIRASVATILIKIPMHLQLFMLFNKYTSWHQYTPTLTSPTCVISRRLWKSIGFYLWPPSTCIWSLKLKFQSKLD